MSKLYLNVGSGYEALDGYYNIDNSLANRVSQSIFFPVLKLFLSKDKLGLINQFSEGSKVSKIHLQDCRKKFKFQDNSVDHILCSHFLEHLFHDECIFVMEEFYRILKPNGTMHIIVPDLDFYVSEYLKDKNPSAADDFMKIILAYSKKGLTFRAKLLDLNGDYGLHHLWMYDDKSMSAKIKDIGFEICENKELIPSKAYRESDDYSLHVFAIKK